MVGVIVGMIASFSLVVMFGGYSRHSQIDSQIVKLRDLSDHACVLIKQRKSFKNIILIPY